MARYLGLFLLALAAVMGFYCGRLESLCNSLTPGAGAYLDAVGIVARLALCAPFALFAGLMFLMDAE